ncbi:MAG: class I SAM-dependent methyltransferase family protein [Nitrososphaerales archaeon]|nr:class I SAM-dependent methyltransferase family protein [Nitrososphaerales archaeon]
MKKLAAALLEEVPNVKCVFQQEGGVEGQYRLRRLTHLAGENRTLTTHKENGCAFKVDVKRTYFSPRLSTERLRVATTVARGERVLNMFAGVGPFSIPIAKRSGARVTSCELNRYACELHLENNRMNKVAGLVEVLNCDAADLPTNAKGGYDRILMPHPSAADRFLPVAVPLCRAGGTIHYYRHMLGRDKDEASENLRREIDGLLPRDAQYKLRRVREVGPRWLELAADITLAG